MDGKLRVKKELGECDKYYYQKDGQRMQITIDGAKAMILAEDCGYEIDNSAPNKTICIVKEDFEWDHY